MRPLPPARPSAVLDAGALIAIERGDRVVAVALEELGRDGAALIVPAGCLAQVWRDPSRQARVARFLRGGGIRLRVLDADDARAVGLLLAARGTSDVIDAHVAVCAIRAGATVLTSDGADIGRLAPGVRVVEV